VTVVPGLRPQIDCCVVSGQIRRMHQDEAQFQGSQCNDNSRPSWLPLPLPLVVLSLHAATSARRKMSAKMEASAGSTGLAAARKALRPRPIISRKMPTRVPVRADPDPSLGPPPTGEEKGRKTRRGLL
jgi:hypothetical protein